MSQQDEDGGDDKREHKSDVIDKDTGTHQEPQARVGEPKAPKVEATPTSPSEEPISTQKGTRYFSTRKPGELHPHSRHDELFPDDSEAYSRLKAAIQQEGRVLVPLAILPDGTVLAGRDRLRAAIELNLADVPVDVREDLVGDEAGQVILLVNDNRARKQLQESVLIRLSEELVKLEAARARQRMSDAGKVGGKLGGRGRKKSAEQGVEPSGTPSKKQRSLDTVAKTLGVSPKRLRAGRAVLAEAKEKPAAALYEQNLASATTTKKVMDTLPVEDQKQLMGDVEKAEPSERKAVARKLVAERLASKRGTKKRPAGDPLKLFTDALRSVVSSAKTLVKAKPTFTPAKTKQIQKATSDAITAIDGVVALMGSAQEPKPARAARAKPAVKKQAPRANKGKGRAS